MVLNCPKTYIVWDVIIIHSMHAIKLHSQTWMHAMVQAIHGTAATASYNFHDIHRKLVRISAYLSLMFRSQWHIGTRLITYNDTVTGQDDYVKVAACTGDFSAAHLYSYVCLIHNRAHTVTFSQAKINPHNAESDGGIQSSHTWRSTWHINPLRSEHEAIIIVFCQQTSFVDLWPGSSPGTAPSPPTLRPDTWDIYAFHP